MIRSGLASKSKTVVPVAVRRAPVAGPGDAPTYRVEGGPEVIGRTAAASVPFGASAEGDGGADRTAFADLWA